MRQIAQCVKALAIALLCSGCAYTTSQSGATKILDTSANDEVGGTGTSSGDVRSMAERMAREITGLQWPQGSAKPTIAVLPLVNTTRFRVDSALLQNKLVKYLLQFSRGRLQFLARSSEQAVMQERAKKRAGHYTAGKTAKSMTGADFLLQGEMRALSKASRSGVSDYIVYTFKLIDSETGAITWMGDYETKKAGDTGVVYQ